MEQVAGPGQWQTGTGGLEAALGRVARRSEAADLVHDRLRRAEQEGESAFRQVVRNLLAEALPIASVLGTCLQGPSAPDVFEDYLQLQALTVLADDIGAGRPRASRYDEYRLLLERELLTEYALPAAELANVQDIHDEMSALPAVLLAMTGAATRSSSSSSERTTPGARRACSRRFAALRPYRESAVDWSRLDLGAGAGSGRTELRDPLALSALERRRAREAAVYHHEFRLDGRTLSDWMREALEDPVPLVRAPARSA